jgi:hypothetical protein
VSYDDDDDDDDDDGDDDSDNDENDNDDDTDASQMPSAVASSVSTSHCVSPVVLVRYKRDGSAVLAWCKYHVGMMSV